MTKVKPPKPTISVNIKYSSMMIHKNTLRLLGNPEYIQILVNPTEKIIVLCRSFKSDYLAHHVNKDIFMESRKSLKICSYALLDNLHKIHPAWIKGNTYRMTGEFIPNMNIIKFKMNNASVINHRNSGGSDE